jgi:YesN/AraC family two-component response regulator
MEEANMQLKKGLSVKEVSFAVGYNDESYFCRRFKKVFGKTPKQYQKDVFN